jgi:spoIIIJ-associated protein
VTPETERQRDVRAEAAGATLGEAKWNAMKELGQRFPGLDADAVRFEVLAEGDEAAGDPARVAGEVDLDAWRAVAQRVPDEPAERVRAIVTRVCAAIGLRASVDIEETEDEIRATVNGEDLGLLIGKHGATIDALQHLAFRGAFRGDDDARKRVTVDAAGYRERREAALRRAADRAVADALSFGRPVELEPMGAAERKIVHQYLSERHEVETHSEGTEPDRRLVVTPVRA